MPGVPEELVRYLARLLAAERRYRGTPARSRKLGCRAQAVMALRWFRDRTRIEALGRDHGVSRATACRYVAEAVDVLSAQAPALPGALERALGDEVPYVILDGKVVAADRCTEKVTSVKGKPIDAWYSGKAHRHGGNVQAVMRPDGLPLWTGPAEPGSTAGLPAARRHALPALYRAAARGIPATWEPESASSCPSRAPRSGTTPASAPAPATGSCASCAAAANAGSPCSPSAGPSSSTSPPAPAASPR
jgi:hypothetical protein